MCCGKLLAVDDFTLSSYSSFEAKIDIWKKETDLFIDFSNINGINEKFKNDMEYLQNSLNLIQDELLWIENNKNKIEEILLEENILELAENIVSEGYLLRCSDEECYLLDDGSKVDFPINEENFTKSIYIESASINFDGKSIDLIELILLCSPDYFNGQSFIISIDKNKNIQFKGLEDF